MADEETGDIRRSGGVSRSVLNLELAIFMQSSSVFIKVLHVALSNDEASSIL